MNVLGAIGAAVAVVEPMLGVLTPVIPLTTMPWLIVAFAIANVVLRFLTTEAINAGKTTS